MGWPKGKPRKGHVNKDGSAHKAKGEKLAADLHIQVVTKPKPEHRVQVIHKPAPVMRVSKVTDKADTPRTGRPIIEPCPNCSFAYADGGYCPSCGWTMFRPDCPHCLKRKR